MIARASAGSRRLMPMAQSGISTASTMSLAQVYARPHEIDVDRHPNGRGIEAVVRDVRPPGDVVRIELERRDGTGSVEVELSRERRGSPRASASIPGRATRRYFSKPRGR